ncbi:MAG: hypothetical protein ACRDPK_09730 [Carbonactinosporaceae bacterium]
MQPAFQLDGAAASKLAHGLEGVGHVEGLSEELSAAFLRIYDRGAIVRLARVGSASDLFAGFLDRDSNGVPPSCGTGTRRAHSFSHLTWLTILGSGLT